MPKHSNIIHISRGKLESILLKLDIGRKQSVQIKQICIGILVSHYDGYLTINYLIQFNVSYFLLIKLLGGHAFYTAQFILQKYVTWK